MKTNIDNIKGKKILVVGFGISGQAAVTELTKCSANVTVQDSKTESEIDANLLAYHRGRGVSFILGSIPEDMSVYDMIVLSPGVDPELDFIKEGVKSGAELTGELEIAYRIGKGSYVAITGTNGKTTTTALVGEIFRKAGRITSVVGNIGNAVISQAADASPDEWLVTEASSFQLESTRYFHPKVSAILNLTPDHLNRHHTMEAYGAAKAKIFANQIGEDHLVINMDDETCFALSKGCRAKVVPFSIKCKPKRGAFLDGDDLVIIDDDGRMHRICSRDDIKMIGDHNVMNVLAAIAVSFHAGIDTQVIRDSVKAFPGVEHRIEFVEEVDGVKYYNDSKGTNIDAALTAINALQKNIILIAGGDAKKQDFTAFASGLNGKVKKVILLGRDAYMLEEAMDKEGFTEYIKLSDMGECVEKAHAIAKEGDSVLLSPACASWDMYDNYEQRGRHFKELVGRL